jgi:manganese/zinc/iron transport system substrate-binding protein
VFLVGALVAVSAAGCGGSGEAGAGEGKVQATTTTTMITDLVRQIGGDRVEVTGLMGPGVDPHLYRASQGDVSALPEADASSTTGSSSRARWRTSWRRPASRSPRYR